MRLADRIWQGVGLQTLGLLAGHWCFAERGKRGDLVAAAAERGGESVRGQLRAANPLEMRLRDEQDAQRVNLARDPDRRADVARGEEPLEDLAAQEAEAAP